MENCIFCKIRDHKLPATFIYEDEDVMVIPDVHPIKPVHLLIIPKSHIKEFKEVEDPALLQKLFVVTQQMIEQSILKDKTYRIKINGGGYQIVDHLHIHLMGPMRSSSE